jgi:hypothetical protein
MQKTRWLLRGVLFVAGGVYVVSGFTTFIDVQISLGSSGVIVLSSTEASELTAVYGGLFLVMASLCFFAKERPQDSELVAFVGLSFFAVAAARAYAVFRYGWPEAPRIYAEFIWEIAAGTAIILLNIRGKKNDSA